MISIIVPVYNGEKYISKCINSIINQTITDWELILIDDGSKDSSGIICDEYSEKDERIKVIHKKNEGVSKARNTGIGLSKGEYICFIDSDDWIDSTFLSDFRTNDFQCDFYFSGALYDTYEKVYSYKKYNERYCKNKSEIRDEFFNQDLLSNGYPWGKLYKAQIIKKYNLNFNENLSIHEDHIFVFQYFLYVNSLYINHAAGYHYTVFDNSGRKLSGRTNSYIELKVASEHFNRIIKQLKMEWNISNERYKILYNSFVISKRLSALCSLILLEDKIYFKEELEFWKKNPYKGEKIKDKLLMFIIKTPLTFTNKYILLRTILMFHQYLKRKNIEKIIYKDLSYRSTLKQN